MVFPSIRCLTCKERRVKCDASRPSCVRCSKAGRHCLWQDSENGSMPFKSENAFAKGQPRRPRKQNSLISQPHRHRPCSLDSRTIKWPPEFFAFKYWKEHLASWPGDLFDVGLEYGAGAFEHWQCAEEPGSSIHFVVTAFSLAVFGRAKQSCEALQSAETFYARSITHLRREILALSTDTIDKLLIATLLLATYDNMMYGFRVRMRQSLSLRTINTKEVYLKMHAHHHNGTASLLQARQQLGFSQNMSLDRALRRPVIRACLHLGQPVQAWLQDDIVYGGKDPALSLDSLMISAAALQSSSAPIINEFNCSSLKDGIHEIKKSIAESQLLDHFFAEWTKNLPQEWMFQTQKSHHNVEGISYNNSSCLFYDNYFNIYTSRGHATFWIRYRAARLLINGIQMQLLVFLRSHMANNRISIDLDPDFWNHSMLCQGTIANLATDLCRDVPFFYDTESAVLSEDTTMKTTLARSATHAKSCITPTMAVLLAWPLSTAINIEAMPSKQRQWLQSRLKAVNDIIGSPMLETLSEI